jgi:hypothetical protein
VARRPLHGSLRLARSRPPRPYPQNMPNNLHNHANYEFPPLYDIPLFCLEAPARPLLGGPNAPANSSGPEPHTGTSPGAPGALDGRVPYGLLVDEDRADGHTIVGFFGTDVVLGVPLRYGEPSEAAEGCDAADAPPALVEKQYWAAMTLVIQVPCPPCLGVGSRAAGLALLDYKGAWARDPLPRPCAAQPRLRPTK